MITGYIRVSTGKQHPENQQDEITRYAKENGMIVDRWVTEIVSGKKIHSGRKLGRLISRMKKGDTIIVSEVSRLSRNLTDIMTIMGSCLKKGINIYTVKERYRPKRGRDRCRTQWGTNHVAKRDVCRDG